MKFVRDMLLARQKTINRVNGKLLNLVCMSYVIWAFDSLSFTFIASALKEEYFLSFLIGPLCALSGFLPSPPLGIYGSVNTTYFYLLPRFSISRNVYRYASGKFFLKELFWFFIYIYEYSAKRNITIITHQILVFVYWMIPPQAVTL